MSEKLHSLLVFAILSQVSLSYSQDVYSMWNNFWSVSCEFSDIVTNVRAKRSIHEEPNFNDPKEMFEYLYPLADMKMDEANQQRSSSHSIATWLDDAVDLWSSECHSRILQREKRDSGNRYPVDEDGYPYEDNSEVSGMNASMNTSKNETLTTTSTTEAPKIEKKVIADGDTFFAQYGGDIEYFFPLIAFGIPFDGEITFLGFHGFKGLFPYR